MRPVAWDTQWPLVPLKDVTEDVSSRDPKKSPHTEFAYVDISAINNQLFVIESPKLLKGRDAPSRARRPIRPGDVLFSNVRTYLRNVAQVEDLGRPAIASTGFTLLRPLASVDPRYLFHLARSESFINRVTPEQTGSHYPATSDQVVRAQLIPLPPIDVQRQISELVDLAEKKRHSVIGDLQTALADIVKFRRSVLDAAVSGRLTEDWRARNAAPAWELAAAEDICAKVQSGTTPKQWHPDPHDGIPFLKVYNIVNQKLNFDHRPQYISADLHSGTMQRACARPGDVLMNIVGPPLGKVAIVSDQFPEWSINQALTLFRPSDRVTTEWLYLFFCSGVSVREIADETRGSVGQSNISLSQCRAFHIPVPSIEEQAEIHRLAGRLLGAAERIEHETTLAMRKTERAAESLLEKALAGEVSGLPRLSSGADAQVDFA